MTELENLICTFSQCQKDLSNSQSHCLLLRVQIVDFRFYIQGNTDSNPLGMSVRLSCVHKLLNWQSISKQPLTEKKKTLRAGENMQVTVPYCLEEAMHRNLVEVFWCCWGINKSLWTGWMRLHQRRSL